MSYRILLNKTRKEAWLDVNDEIDEEAKKEFDFISKMFELK